MVGGTSEVAAVGCPGGGRGLAGDVVGDGPCVVHGAAGGGVQAAAGDDLPPPVCGRRHPPLGARRHLLLRSPGPPHGCRRLAYRRSALVVGGELGPAFACPAEASRRASAGGL
ncbi:hypothetical protein PF008_g32322 [Phytophthora fragariae]|uniref:Uncharacterized protein n=1 Tax=Phytophthora fragariae TaxID=53985 RepID=A0A6G0Q0A2_9STRA|nr:hypothetical protein PF008_g32322 [Phytophthora fragariae]